MWPRRIWSSRFQSFGKEGFAPHLRMGLPLKRSFVTFDRGGQTGPPRSNDFFSAPLTTRAPPGRPAGRPLTTGISQIIRTFVQTGESHTTPGVRPDVRAARVSSAAPKKKSFDRGGPVWPPRSNVTNDRLRGGSGGALPPQPKFGGSGGQRPPAKTRDG